MSSLHVNLIHRADSGPETLEALRFQLEEAQRLGLQATVLVSYRAFFDSAMMAYLQELRQKRSVEFGIHTHCLVCPDYIEHFKTRESALYYLSRSLKAAVLKRLFELFEKAFGFEPKAIGAYILDAWTQNHIKEAHPGVEVAITNCFEEGVKMYHGNDNSWYLFSDGGPWGPFYPSKESSLCPARDEAEWNGLVALPHLNRDMLMALTSRDDYFSSHPVNLFRARINEGAECPYAFRFINEWNRQLEVNGYAYYSLFVSSPWLADGHWAIENVNEARSLYSDTLGYLRDMVDAGEAVSETMLDTARNFRETKRIGSAEQCHWIDALRSKGREVWWQATPDYRAAIDLNAGASIVDLRPWCGRNDLNMGPEEPALWNGNYPFVISSEHRGGQKRCSQRCVLEVGDQQAELVGARYKVEVADRESFSTDRREARVGDATVKIRSRFDFSKEGCIEVERILEDSDTSLPVRVTESFRGCVGQTEYPEDLRGIVLRVAGADSDATELEFNYDSRTLERKGSGSAQASIPSLRASISLGVEDSDVSLEAREGVMFDPFFELRASRELKPGESLKTCLRISKI